MYEYVFHLFVRFPIKNGPGVLVKVSVQEHCAFKKQVF